MKKKRIKKELSKYFCRTDQTCIFTDNLASVNWVTNLSGPNVPIGQIASGTYVSVSTMCLPNVSGHLFSAAIVSELDVSPSFVSGSIVFAPIVLGP